MSMNYPKEIEQGEGEEEMAILSPYASIYKNSFAPNPEKARLTALERLKDIPRAFVPRQKPLEIPAIENLPSKAKVASFLLKSTYAVSYDGDVRRSLSQPANNSQQGKMNGESSRKQDHDDESMGGRPLLSRTFQSVAKIHYLPPFPTTSTFPGSTGGGTTMMKSNYQRSFPAYPPSPHQGEVGEGGVKEKNFHLLKVGSGSARGVTAKDIMSSPNKMERRREVEGGARKGRRDLDGLSILDAGRGGEEEVILLLEARLAKEMGH